MLSLFLQVEKNLLNIINDILELSKAEAGEGELNIEDFSVDESIKKSYLNDSSADSSEEH